MQRHGTKYTRIRYYRTARYLDCTATAYLSNEFNTLRDHKSLCFRYSNIVNFCVVFLV